jgi:hypothetical protein
LKPCSGETLAQAVQRAFAGEYGFEYTGSYAAAAQARRPAAAVHRDHRAG